MASAASATRRAMFARLLRDRDGFVIVMVALLLTVLIGFAGLAAETGLWYAIKRQNQSAADEAAISGAMELLAAKTDWPALASCAASKNGFSAAHCTGTPPTCGGTPISVCQCYNYTVGGTCTAPTGAQVANAIEVILSQNQSSLLASVALPNVTIMTRAVAALSSIQNGCMLALNQSQQGITISGGSTTVTAPGCVVASNSNHPHSVTVSGGAQLTAQSILTMGGIDPSLCTGCNLTSPATVSATTATIDPYASTTVTIPTSCTPGSNLNVMGSSTLPQPGKCYTGIDFSATVTVNPGIYYISNGGPFKVDSGVTLTNSTTGSPGGVMFVLYGGNSSNITNNGIMTLNAPTSAPATGVPSGIVFWQDKATVNCCANDVLGSGPATANLTGAVYVPHGKITFSGSSGTSGSACTVLIGDSLTFSGSSTLNTSGCKALGVTEATTGNVVVLAE